MDATTYSKLLRCGNYADYQAIVEKDSNVLYFCQDNGKLYKGTVDFSDSFKVVTSSTIPEAANAVPGFIYYESDTHIFKTLLSGAYVEIGNPIDAVGDGTTHTFSASSSDAEVPSSKNVWLYGQAIKAEVEGGSDVVKNVSAGATDAGIVVTKGDDSTSAVTVPGVFVDATAGATAGQIIFTDSSNATSGVVVAGVIKGVAAGASAGQIIITDTADATSAVSVPLQDLSGYVKGVAAGATDGTIVVTAGDDSTAAVTVPGVVTTPTWDETALKLTLPVAGGTSVEVNIPKDIFLESGSYDATNKKIIRVLNDASSTTIEFSVSDLIPIYDAADTSTVATSIDWDATNGKYIISAAAKLSDATANALTYDATGLLVDGSAFADATDFANLVSSHNSLADAFAWGSFT